MSLRLLLGAVTVAVAAILVDAAWGNRALSATAVVIGFVLVVGPHVYFANRRTR